MSQNYKNGFYSIDSQCFNSHNPYRFGFNGQENDNEIQGGGNSYDFGARIYDSRLGTWMACDPLAAKYPDLSSYCFVGNSTMVFKDIDGKKLLIYYEDSEGNIVPYEYGSGLPVPDSYFLEQTISALNKISSNPQVAIKLDVLIKTQEYNINIYWGAETISWAKAYPSKDKDGKEIMVAKKNQDVFYNPRLGLKEIATGKINAPYVNLWHELGHMYNLITATQNFFKRFNNKYKSGDKSKWTQEEDEFNIQENEWLLIGSEGFKRQAHKIGEFYGVKEVKTKDSVTPEEKK